MRTRNPQLEIKNSIITWLDAESLAIA